LNYSHAPLVAKLLRLVSAKQPRSVRIEIAALPGIAPKRATPYLRMSVKWSPEYAAPDVALSFFG